MPINIPHTISSILQIILAIVAALVAVASGQVYYGGAYPAAYGAYGYAGWPTAAVASPAIATAPVASYGYAAGYPSAGYILKK